MGKLVGSELPSEAQIIVGENVQPPDSGRPFPNLEPMRRQRSACRNAEQFVGGLCSRDPLGDAELVIEVVQVNGTAIDGPDRRQHLLALLARYGVGLVDATTAGNLPTSWWLSS